MTAVYAAPHQWNTSVRGLLFWEPPRPGHVGSIDFRSLPQMGTAGGIPHGFGLFTYPDRVGDETGMIYLGRSLTAQLNLTQLSLARSAFGVLNLPSNLLDMLRALLTIHADPTGATRWRPLIPTVQRTLDIHLGGFSCISSESCDCAHPHWPQILAVLHGDYKQIKQQVMAGQIAPGHHRRMLTAWMEKYRIPMSQWEQLVPQGYPKESPLPHRTVLSESFNQADSTTLGPVLTWTEVAGDWDTLTNEVRLVSVGGASKSARAEAYLASSDAYAQLLVTSHDGGILGTSFCFAAAAETFYGVFVEGSLGRINTEKMIAGVMTEIGGTGITIALPEIYKGQKDGSTIKGFQAGTERSTFTDTSITGNLRGGLFGRVPGGGGSVRGDNFEEGDLAADAGQPFLSRFSAIPFVPTRGRSIN